MMIGAMLAMTMMAQATACPVPAPTVPGLAGWNAPRRVASGSLAVGVASSVALTPDVRFPVAPEKAPAAGTTGAVLPIVIATPGRYRIAIGTAAWIDLIGAGKPVASIAHGHGPACTGVRKMVEFQLAAGRYSIQLSGATTPMTTVMVAAMR